MLFVDFINEWKKLRLGASEGWRICQDQIIRDHISPYLDDLKMNEITPAQISFVLAQSRKKNHSDNQTKKIYMVLSKIFSDAINEFEILTKSPVKKKLHLTKTRPIARSFLNPSEVWQLLEKVSNDKSFGVAVWIQVFTGLRVGEVQGLQWDDIDFKNSTVHIKRKFNRITKKMDLYTKNGSHFVQPLAPILANFLHKIKKKSGFVCTNSSGEMFSYWSYRSYLLRTSKKLNLSISASHDLRHSSAFLLRSVGASIEDLQKFLNHSSAQSTRVYDHFKIDESVKNLLKKIA